jgi:hypothetical protein
MPIVLGASHGSIALLQWCRQTKGDQMTERDIEMLVERKIDHLDRLFLRGAISQKAYNSALKELSQWAEAKYMAEKRSAA